MGQLLEDTGYSYSGISDVIRNHPEQKRELLMEIDSFYCETRDELEKARKKVAELEGNMSLAASSFIQFHRVLHQDGLISEYKLSYLKEKEAIVVDINPTENRIIYGYYERADI